MNWKVKEIAVVSEIQHVGKVRLEALGEAGYQSSLILYVPLDELPGYQIGSSFEGAIMPAVKPEVEHVA